MWMNLESIILSERSQSRKTAYYMTSFLFNFSKCKVVYTERESRPEVVWGWECGEEKLGVGEKESNFKTIFKEWNLS